MVLMVMKTYRLLLLLPLLAIVLIGCAHHPSGTPLEQISNLKSGDIKFATNRNGHIRMAAIRDEALSLGAQEALAQRSIMINKTLKHNARHLDEIYNFNVLVLPHDVLPPVLAEAHNTLNLASDDAIRLSDATYKIVKQARFITTPPTWRDYLWMKYSKPQPPEPTLLPKCRAETKVWRKYILIGWSNGLKQADAIFLQNLNRLKRDYQGIIIYRKLLAQNMVSAPFVVKTRLGVTGGGNNLRIGDKVLRITALPALSPDSSQWKPALETQKAKYRRRPNGRLGGSGKIQGKI